MPAADFLVLYLTTSQPVVVPACRQTDTLVSHALSPCDPRSRWWSLVQIHLVTPTAGIPVGTKLMRAYFCYGKGGRSCQQDRAETWTVHVFLANWGADTELSLAVDRLQLPEKYYQNSLSLLSVSNLPACGIIQVCSVCGIRD